MFGSRVPCVVLGAVLFKSFGGSVSICLSWPCVAFLSVLSDGVFVLWFVFLNTGSNEFETRKMIKQKIAIYFMA